MNITFYVTSSAENVLTKTLANEYTLTGTLRDAANIINPVIMVATDPTPYNYCYIPQLNRYYYVDEITVYRKNVWVVTLKCDVLMSFKDEIKKLRVVTSRLANGSAYYGDGVPRGVKPTKTVSNFTSPFVERGSLICVTRGGR